MPKEKTVLGEEEALRILLDVLKDSNVPFDQVAFKKAMLAKANNTTVEAIEKNSYTTELPVNIASLADMMMLSGRGREKLTSNVENILESSSGLLSNELGINFVKLQQELGLLSTLNMLKKVAKLDIGIANSIDAINGIRADLNGNPGLRTSLEAEEKIKLTEARFLYALANTLIEDRDRLSRNDIQVMDALAGMLNKPGSQIDNLEILAAFLKEKGVTVLKNEPTINANVPYVTQNNLERTKSFEAIQ